MALPRGIVVLLALLLPGAPAEAGDRPTVRVQFRVLAFEGAPLYYRPRPEAPLHRITLHTSAPSAALRYEGPPLLELLPSPAPGPPAASIPIGAAPRVLVVIPPGLDPADGSRLSALRPLVIPDDLAAVPLNTVTVLNVSGRPYQIGYDDGRGELEVMGQVSLPARAVGRLLLSAQVGGRWRQVTINELEVEQDARAWVVLWPPYRSGQLQPRVRVMFDQGH
jgi:hypothetical protein